MSEDADSGRNRRLRSSPVASALTDAGYWPGPDFVRAFGTPMRVSGPFPGRGSRMRIVGEDDEGRTVLEDRSGRRYTQDAKGTIRRVKTK